MKLTLQVHWGGQWHDTGTIGFRDERQGLFGKPSFTYEAGYVLDVLERANRQALQELTGKKAVGVNLPPNDLGTDYFNGEIAPVLRDIIPQGASRRLWISMLGYDRDPREAVDAHLLAVGGVAPIGNLRIKEAAEAFQERVSKGAARLFTAEEVAIRADRLLEYAHELGIAIGGATGAGGDAPKLLLAENHEGRFALESTIAETEVRQHWLVKFPRGRKAADDINVLRGEAAIYRTLEDRKIESITGARLREADGRFSLWLPRFDRKVAQGGVERHGVESVYSVMGRIGDGAALDHAEVLEKLKMLAEDSENEDRLLADYLVKDVLNTTVGNRDNHGRNMALIKDDDGVRLAPAYDVAPMVLDPEGIARSTRWLARYCGGINQPDYAAIIHAFANDVSEVRDILARKLARIVDIRETLMENGAPMAMIEHPGVRLGYPAEVLEQLSQAASRGPSPG